MAFPVPSHLPRKPTSQDVSSKILSKIDEATSQNLNAELAASWLTELDDTIRSTKSRIHEGILVDLPSFEQQLSSSKSVQTRLQTLTSNVENLSQALSHPETGVISTLVKALSSHAALAQKATDANVKYGALLYLSRCRNGLLGLSALVEDGKLPEAVGACVNLEKLLMETSLPVSQASVMTDLHHEFRAAKDRAEEQLSESYSRSIMISPTEIEIRPSVQVRQSETILTLDAILSALSPRYITEHLNTLRRDLTTHYILHTLTQPTSITLTTSTSGSAHDLAYKLTQLPSPRMSSPIPTRLSNLSAILTFLSTHLFPFLPPFQLSAFRQSLCKPISDAILNRLLIPALPSSFAHLPAFLDLVKQAVEFEDTYIGGILDAHSNKVIKNWADGVSGHYERKRRMEILEHARDAIMRAKEVKTFRAEVEHTRQISPVQVETEVEKDDVATEDESQAWGFDDEEMASDDESQAWGFDDEETANDDEEPSAGPAERETYLVSACTREILVIVEDVLREGNDFASCTILPSAPLSSPRGTILLQSGSAAVDLFRALSPIHVGETQGGSRKGMQFSNDCLYLSKELGNLGPDEQLVECIERLKILGDSWFDDTIEKQRRSVDGILVTVEGFTYTTEQDRYDECEDAISRVVREIRTVAHQWKSVLAKSKYYTAVGLVADAALSRILEDVLALPDITEVESHRLGELCRILNALEGLFVEDASQPSFVAAYVPSWLKFSYLSELLEASMADISYLFEEGALVDFTTEELTRLVRALFADTPLRTTTINKFLVGHNRGN